MGTMGLEELNRLAAEVEACTLCQLSKTRTHVVPGEGRPTAEIMFIGEGPGFNEDQQGRPFVGRAGKFLDFLISSIGLNRGDVYITNIVKCRPPNNRDPLPVELSACLPFLQRQIESINPKIIVTLGRHSLGTFFPGEGISRLHGAVRQKNGRYFFPMYHPAAALHQEKYRQTIIEDMQKLGQWLDKTHEQERTSDERQARDKMLQFGLPQEAKDQQKDDGRQLALF